MTKKHRYNTGDEVGSAFCGRSEQGSEAGQFCRPVVDHRYHTGKGKPKAKRSAQNENDL